MGGRRSIARHARRGAPLQAKKIFVTVEVLPTGKVGSYSAKPASIEGTEFDRRRPGLNHLAFHVDTADEVEELVGSLRDRGTRLLYEDRHPYAGGVDHYAAFVEDPDGLKVELVADDRTRA